MSELAQEYPDNTIENREKAVADGMEVIDGTDHTLLLDLDNEAAIAQYHRMLPYMKQFGAALHPDEWASKSGKGRHVRIWLDKPATIHERIALQLLLGSDPFREMLSIRNVREGQANPIMLFKPAYVVAEEKAERERKDREFIEIFGVPA